MASFNLMSGQGDIYSIGGISFASPVNDILDKEIFTLEELLQEDEILQEVKARNGRLIDFIVQESSLLQMIDYIIVAPDPSVGETRVFKLPYMSCEVFCCETPELLQYLANDTENKILKSLFSILENDSPLDNYLAGYFEKILEMLFRRLTVPVMSYFNQEDQTMNLFTKFLKHIDNYSVMQVVQRLLLPHIPFSMPAQDADPPSTEERERSCCHWSYIPAACQLLCGRMLQTTSNTDVAAHVSDLLITVIQLSPPDALFLTHLCENKCLSTLTAAMFRPGTEAINPITEPLSPVASVSLASISVLESLVSKLCEVNAPMEGTTQEPAELELLAISEATIKRNIKSVTSYVIPLLPTLAAQLAAQLAVSGKTTLPLQDKRSVPRLGHRPAQLVKLLESLVRVNEDEVDMAIVQSGALKVCVDLMFVYEANSMMQLSVHRMIVMLLEGGQRKRAAQLHILKDCNLLPRIISHVTVLNIDPNVKSCRLPIVGHLIYIAQTIQSLVVGIPVTTSSVVTSNESKDGAPTTTTTPAAPANDPILDAAMEEEKIAYISMLKEMPYYALWNEFIASVLTHIIAIQNTVQIIVDAKSAEFGAAANMMLQNSNFNQVMFNRDKTQDTTGFFDDDDDDDDLDEDDLRGIYNENDTVDIGADFAQFDAFSASMMSGSSSSHEDNDSNNSSDVFSFASFDNPGLFATDTSAFSQIPPNVKPSSDLDDIFSAPSNIASVFDFSADFENNPLPPPPGSPSKK